MSSQKIIVTGGRSRAMAIACMIAAASQSMGFDEVIVEDGLGAQNDPLDLNGLIEATHRPFDNPSRLRDESAEMDEQHEAIRGIVEGGLRDVRASHAPMLSSCRSPAVRAPPNGQPHESNLAKDVIHNPPSTSVLSGFSSS